MNRRNSILNALMMVVMTIFVAPSWPRIAFAVEGDPLNYIVQIERRLEDRISTVVRSQDPDAMVFVQVGVKSSKIQLPLTPFSMPAMVDVDPLGKPEIASLKIDVYVKKDAITPVVRQIINNLAKQVSPSANITISERPQTAREKSPDVDRQGPKAWFDEARTFLNGTNLLETVGLSQARMGIAINTLIGLAIGGLLIGLGVWFTFISTLRGQSRSIRDGVSQVSDAIKSGTGDGEGGGIGAALTQMASLMGGKGATGNVTVTGSAKEFFAELPSEGVLAILSDCYWAKLDNYASHVWRNLPVRRRAELLAAWTPLPAYVEHIAPLDPDDLQMEQDPAYLQPLHIQNLGNDTLTSIVRENPAVLRQLSLIRKQSLSLTITEQLNINKMNLAISRSEADALCSGADHTSERKFFARIKVREVSQSHEQELLVIQELNKHLLEDLPTLVWANRLSDEKLKDILRNFSAMDLASSWIGPEEVLARLSGALPEKKRTLLESYRSKTVASRQNPAFKSLHRGIVDAVILEMESGITGVESSPLANPDSLGRDINGPKVA